MPRKSTLLCILLLIGALAILSHSAWSGQYYYWIHPKSISFTSWRHHPLLTRTKVKQTCRRYWQCSALARKPK